MKNNTISITNVITQETETQEVFEYMSVVDVKAWYDKATHSDSQRVVMVLFEELQQVTLNRVGNSLQIDYMDTGHIQLSHDIIERFLGVNSY